PERIERRHVKLISPALRVHPDAPAGEQFDPIRGLELQPLRFALEHHAIKARVWVFQRKVKMSAATMEVEIADFALDEHGGWNTGLDRLLDDRRHLRDGHRRSTSRRGRCSLLDDDLLSKFEKIHRHVLPLGSGRGSRIFTNG